MRGNSTLLDNLVINTSDATSKTFDASNLTFDSLG